MHSASPIFKLMYFFSINLHVSAWNNLTLISLTSSWFNRRGGLRNLELPAYESCFFSLLVILFLRWKILLLTTIIVIEPIINDVFFMFVALGYLVWSVDGVRTFLEWQFVNRTKSVQVQIFQLFEIPIWFYHNNYIIIYYISKFAYAVI